MVTLAGRARFFEAVATIVLNPSCKVMLVPAGAPFNLTSSSEVRSVFWMSKEKLFPVYSTTS